MKLLLWLAQSIFVVIGVLATYLPLIADYRKFDMWGLAWQTWVMIGVTVLWVSMASIILRLYLENRKLRSPEHKLQLEKLEREVEKLRQEQYTIDTGTLV